MAEQKTRETFVWWKLYLKLQSTEKEDARLETWVDSEAEEEILTTEATEIQRVQHNL